MVHDDTLTVRGSATGKLRLCWAVGLGLPPCRGGQEAETGRCASTPRVNGPIGHTRVVDEWSAIPHRALQVNRKQHRPHVLHIDVCESGAVRDTVQASFRVGARMLPGRDRAPVAETTPQIVGRPPAPGPAVPVAPIPGLTAPFLSCGGSSLLANDILIALLPRISHATATRCPTGPAPARSQVPLAHAATRVGIHPAAPRAESPVR